MYCAGNWIERNESMNVAAIQVDGMTKFSDKMKIFRIYLFI